MTNNPFYFCQDSRGMSAMPLYVSTSSQPPAGYSSYTTPYQSLPASSLQPMHGVKGTRYADSFVAFQPNTQIRALDSNPSQGQHGRDIAYAPGHTESLPRIADIQNSTQNRLACHQDYPSASIENFLQRTRAIPVIDYSIPPKPHVSKKSKNYLAHSVRTGGGEKPNVLDTASCNNTGSAVRILSLSEKNSFSRGTDRPNIPSTIHNDGSLPASTSRSALRVVKSAIGKKCTGSSGGPQKKVRSSKSNIPGTSRYWTPSEHKLFIMALLKYGPKDLKSIAEYVGTRNMIQCRTHEQKCFMRLMREAQRETELRRSSAGRPSGGCGGNCDTDEKILEWSNFKPSMTSLSSSSTAVEGSGLNGCISTSPSLSSSWSSDIVTPSNPEQSPRPDVPNDNLSVKPVKDVYSVSSSCGITLLCVVSEEMSRALSC